MTKNTVIILVVVVLVILGLLFFFVLPENNSALNPIPQGNTNNTNTNTSGNNGTSSSNTTDGQNNTNVTVGVGANVGVNNVKTFNVAGENFSFSPNEIRVRRGDTVRIVFDSETGMHDLKIDEFNVGTKILRASDPAETIEFVADKTGTFEFYCSVGSHRQMGMVGNLIVTE